MMRARNKTKEDSFADGVLELSLSFHRRTDSYTTAKSTEIRKSFFFAVA